MPDYYALDYINPTELEGPDFREDLSVYYVASAQPYYSDDTYVWDPDADDEYGQWVMRDDPVVDPHGGPEVWHEDGDEDDHYELDDIDIPMEQLTTMWRMQMG